MSREGHGIQNVLQFCRGLSARAARMVLLITPCLSIYHASCATKRNFITFDTRKCYWTLSTLSSLY